jgi:hypothetical protein
MERHSQTRLTRPRNSRYRRNIGLRPAMGDDLVWGYPCSLTVKHGNGEGLNDVRTVLQKEDRRRRCGAWAAKGGSMCALHSNPGGAVGDYSRLCGGEGCMGGLNLQSEQSAKRLASGCFQPSILIGNGCRLRIHWTIQASGIKLVVVGVMPCLNSLENQPSPPTPSTRFPASGCATACSTAARDSSGMRGGIVS